jgi:hypothetical protein
MAGSPITLADHRLLVPRRKQPRKRIITSPCTVASLFVAIILAILSDHEEAPSLAGDRKVVFLGPGCGNVAYSFGFIAQLFFEDSDIREAFVQSGAVFGGTSSGAMVGAAAMAVLNGCGESMREWYQTELRRGFEVVKNDSTLAMGNELLSSAHRYWDKCTRPPGVRAPPWLRTFPVSLTSLPSLRPVFVSEFSTRAEFTSAMQATSYVPGVMGLRTPYVDVARVGRCIDGFTGLWRTRLPDTHLYFAFLPVAPHGIAAHEVNVGDYDSTGGGVFGVLSKAWPWGDPEWADAAFERGMADAAAHMHELRPQIIDFLRPHTT